MLKAYYWKPNRYERTVFHVPLTFRILANGLPSFKSILLTSNSLEDSSFSYSYGQLKLWIFRIFVPLAKSVIKTALLYFFAYSHGIPLYYTANHWAYAAIHVKLTIVLFPFGLYTLHWKSLGYITRFNFQRTNSVRSCLISVYLCQAWKPLIRWVKGIKLGNDF